MLTTDIQDQVNQAAFTLLNSDRVILFMLKKTTFQKLSNRYGQGCGLTELLKRGNFNRISHLSGAMGVLVHQSYRGELANGVAVSMNIFNPFITGYYVNVQIGEDMVTNPESESVPEEFLLTEQNITGSVTREIQYIRFSNRVQPGERILSAEQIERLADYLDMIHNHYRLVYGINTGNLDFATEIEFKINFAGELIVKQARPWVCRTGND